MEDLVQSDDITTYPMEMVIAAEEEVERERAAEDGARRARLDEERRTWEEQRRIEEEKLKAKWQAFRKWQRERRDERQRTRAEDEKRHRAEANKRLQELTDAQRAAAALAEAQQREQAAREAAELEAAQWKAVAEDELAFRRRFAETHVAKKRKPSTLGEIAVNVATTALKRMAMSYALAKAKDILCGTEALLPDDVDGEE